METYPLVGRMKCEEFRDGFVICQPLAEAQGEHWTRLVVQHFFVLYTFNPAHVSQGK